MSSEKPKISIIGLDGATRNILRMMGILNKKGWLCSDLRSIIPPYTPPAWNSIVTGVNPAKHGIIGFRKINIQTRTSTLYTSRDLKFPRMFELLSSRKIKSVVANVPQTYPFEGITHLQNMTIISDWASPVQGIYPKELDKEYSDYLLEPPTPSRAGNNINEYLKSVEEFLDGRLQIYYDLLEDKNWDLYFVIFSETDWIQHVIPEIVEGKEKAEVKKIFAKIKKFIDDAQELSDITLLVSDHGFEIKRKILHINTALKNARLLSTSASNSLMLGVASKVFKAATKLSPVRRLLKKKKFAKSGLLYSLKDDTKAAIFEPDTWGVHLFDKSYKDVVISELKKIDELSNVYDAVDLYNVPELPEFFPEIIVHPKDGVAVSHELNKDPVENTYKSEHAMIGIFCASGEHIKEDAQPSTTPILYDVTPTILHIYGMPIPQETDGRVLYDIFTENSQYYNKKSRYISIKKYSEITERQKLRNTIKYLKLRESL